MIVAVTPNPALDLTYPVTRLHPGHTHRVHDPVARAGGKGVNVASVLQATGHRSVVVCPVGGVAGNRFEQDLDDRGLTHRLLHTELETRHTVTIVDPEHGATAFNEAGAAPPARLWVDLLATVDELVSEGAHAVCVCGSLPAGAAEDWIAELVRHCHEAGARSLLDLSAGALASALDAGPDLVTPNATEAATVTGTTDPAQSARELVRLGARRAVVSDGSRGLLAATPDRVWRARMQSPLVGNPTGAGDALAAALAVHPEWPDGLRHGVAWSAAAVLAQVAGEIDPVRLPTLLAAVQIEEVR